MILKTCTLILEKHIYLISALLSLLISLWLFASNDIISRDATVYIEVAQAFHSGGISAAFAVWKWPFYSIVIDIVHQLTGLGFDHSAYLLTIIFETVITVTFVKVYSKIAFDGARLWVAMLFILTFLALNDYKADIIRGYGFWAFTLIAVYQFITYFQTKCKSSAFLWQISIIIAALFRPEAVVFAALAPLYFLFNRDSSLVENIKQLLMLHSVFYLVGFLAMGVIASSNQIRDAIFSNLPAQVDYFSPEKIFYNFNVAVENFIQYVLPFDYSARYSYLILASGLLSMLLFKLVNNLTLIYSGIWLTGSYKRWINLKQESYIIYYFAFIAFLILGVFITSKLFISSRYTVLLLLLIGLIISQYLDYLIAYLNEQKKVVGLSLLSIFIAFQFLDGVISTGAKKTPIKQSAEWVIGVIKPGDRVACNEMRYAHYTQQKCFLADNRFYKSYSSSDIQFLKNNNYTYLLLWVKHKNSKMLKLLEQDDNLVPLKRFENRKKDVGLVYKIKI